MQFIIERVAAEMRSARATAQAQAPPITPTEADARTKNPSTARPTT